METKQQEITLSNGVVLRQNGKYKLMTPDEEYKICIFIMKIFNRCHYYIFLTSAYGNEYLESFTHQDLLNRNIQEYRESRKVEKIIYVRHSNISCDKDGDDLLNILVGKSTSNHFYNSEEAARADAKTMLTNCRNVAEVTINATVKYLDK